MPTASCIQLEAHKVSGPVLFIGPDPEDAIFIHDIVVSLSFSRQVDAEFFLGGDRSGPWMWRGLQNRLTHVCIDCMPRLVMPVSVGVTVGSLPFCPHPATIKFDSTSL